MSPNTPPKVEVRVDDREVGKLLEQAPGVSVFHLRKAVAGMARDFKKQLVAQQVGKGMKRLARAGSSILVNPKKGSRSAARRFAFWRGAENVQAEVVMRGELAAAHEYGAEISRGGIGMAVRHPQWARNYPFTGRNTSSKTLAAVIESSPFPIVWIRSKRTGLLTVYRDESKNQKKVRKRNRFIGPQLPGHAERPILNPIVTFLNRVRIKPQLGFGALAARFGATEEKHLAKAVEGIRSDLEEGRSG